MLRFLHWTEKLVEDLTREGLLQAVEHQENISLLHTEKYLLIIYYPHSERIKPTVDKKIIHLDIDLLASAYFKVLDRIRSLCGRGRRLFARNTVVARIDKEMALAFLEEYHLQVALAGKYRYGLFYKGDLVSVAVFSGGRRMRDQSAEYRSFELLRFCHKGGYLIVGGISKLLKAFIEDFKPDDIMTYADRDWSDESSLTRIGFKEEGRTEGQLFYIREGRRYYTLGEGESYDYIVKNTGSIKLKLYLS